jgi:antitoxin CptB
MNQETRRKRILYHCRKRGRVETELFFGSFASENIWKLQDKELDQFESLLSEEDVDLYNWVLGKAPIPPEHDNEFFKKIMDYVKSNKVFNEDYDKEDGVPPSLKE